MKTKFNLSAVLGMAVAASLVLETPLANATLFDLSTAPISGVTLPDGSIYQANDPATSTGTGVINPFLSLQADPSEQGYNTNAGDFDTKRNGQYTTDLMVGDLKLASNNINYVSFLIDVNQNNNATKISLDRLMIWTSPTAMSSSAVDANGNFIGSLGTLRYDLDSTANGGSSNSVLYIDGLSGSGAGDIRVFIPRSVFAGLALDQYIYMYQQWGTTPGYETNGGFEETLSFGTIVIPEATSLIPLGLVMAAGIGLHLLRRRSILAAA